MIEKASAKWRGVEPQIFERAAGENPLLPGALQAVEDGIVIPVIALARASRGLGAEAARRGDVAIDLDDALHRELNEELLFGAQTPQHRHDVIDTARLYPWRIADRPVGVLGPHGAKLVIVGQDRGVGEPRDRAMDRCLVQQARECCPIIGHHSSFGVCAYFSSRSEMIQPSSCPASTLRNGVGVRPSNVARVGSTAANSPARAAR